MIVGEDARLVVPAREHVVQEAGRMRRNGRLMAVPVGKPSPERNCAQIEAFTTDVTPDFAETETRTLGSGVRFVVPEKVFERGHSCKKQDLTPLGQTAPLRQAAGGQPVARLKARLNAASEL